jgi:hypothetical protein
MTDLDDTLFMGKNQRPAFLPGFPGVTQYALFPSLAAPNYLDFGVVMALAQAGPVYAVFRVATAFNNQADIVIRPAIFIDDDPTFATVLTDPSLVVARGHDLVAAGLGVVGTIVGQVALPPLSDLTRLAGDGRRCLALGLQGVIPTSDFAAGGMDAFLTAHPFPTRPIHYRAGW